MTDGTAADEPFALPVDEPQPSQCYLNGRKLSLATQWFDFDDPTYDPLPVRRLDGEWVLLDGHTRAFLARLAGAEAVPVTPADVPPEAEPMYARCVEWCREAGVARVGDLVGRVVDADTFVEVWVERCRAAPEYPD